MRREGSIYLGTVPAGSHVEHLPDGSVAAFLPDGSAKRFYVAFTSTGVTPCVDTISGVTISIGRKSS